MSQVFSIDILVSLVMNNTRWRGRVRECILSVYSALMHLKILRGPDCFSEWKWSLKLEPAMIPTSYMPEKYQT